MYLLLLITSIQLIFYLKLIEEGINDYCDISLLLFTLN
jgi:hypothetical protein